MKTPKPLLCALVIALLALAAYANSFSGPLIFDDHDVIEKNASIQSLATALFPPKADGMTVSGRPLINLSLGINYAIGGMDLTGYHVVNFLVHLAAALALFGLVRRMLLLSGHGTPLQAGAVLAPPGFWNEGEPTLIAFCVSLLWALHPLQTESVSYIAQRAESIVSLFYLLTLYGFVRGVEPRPATAAAGSAHIRISRKWAALSVTACFAGMASKEVMVSAPLAVLALDALFVGGGFRAALRRQRGYYAALFASWILLAILVAQSGGRGGTAGANAGMTVGQYVVIQVGAIVHYLRLALWPSPLVFDYGPFVEHSPLEAVGPGLILMMILGATAWLAWKKPRLGFLAVLFFAILAPSSSVVPVATQTVAEHRMYLALAALITLAVLGLWALLGRRAVPVCVAGALALGVATFMRNRAYADELSLWSDTVHKVPANPRAHANLGRTYLVRDQDDLAAAELETALRLEPHQAEAHFNRGLIAQAHGDFALAAEHFDAAVGLRPGYADAHNNLALALDGLGRLGDALREAAEAVRLDPQMAESQVNLGNFLARSGQPADALPHFQRGVELDPKNALVRMNYATALFQGGQLDEARLQLERAKELAPDDFEVHQRLGAVLLQMNRPAEAASELRRALELNPNLPAARDLLQRIKP